MIALKLRNPAIEGPEESRKRRGFGLDSPLPADRRIILRAVLRHLATERPAVVVLGLGAETPVPRTAAGRVNPEAPDLLLLAPGGRSVFVKIKLQAEDLTRDHRAFADLCRSCAVPLVVVRSLPEARQAFDRLRL